MATGVAATLYYWKRSKGGPKKAHLVFEDGTSQFVDLNSHESFEAARQTWGTAIGLILQVPVDSKWSGHFYDAQKNWKWTLGGGKDTPAEAIAALLEGRTTEIAEYNARIADPAANLEFHLKGHDWYYAYSDDHSVWSGGEANIKRITELIRQVPADTARRLWTQYAPADVTFPGD